MTDPTTNQERETETKMLKTEVKRKDAVHEGDGDVTTLEGAHFLTHPATGQTVLVVSVERLATRVRVWVAAYDRYHEFVGHEGCKGLWDRPTEEVRAAAEERIVIFNNVGVNYQ